jgi:hypothetical protein
MVDAQNALSVFSRGTEHTQSAKHNSTDHHGNGRCQIAAPQTGASWPCMQQVPERRAAAAYLPADPVFAPVLAHEHDA